MRAECAPRNERRQRDRYYRRGVALVSMLIAANEQVPLYELAKQINPEEDGILGVSDSLER